MKKQYTITVAVIVSVIFLGVLSRYTVSELAYGASHINKANISVLSMGNEFVLNEENSDELYGLLLKGKPCDGGGGTLFSDDSGRTRATVMGTMFITPRWIDWSCFRPVIKLFRNGITIFYDPFNESLFLSDYSVESDWDCYNGWGATNIPCRLIGLDLMRLKKERKRVGYDDN